MNVLSFENRAYYVFVITQKQIIYVNYTNYIIILYYNIRNLKLLFYIYRQIYLQKVNLFLIISHFH